MNSRHSEYRIRSITVTDDPQRMSRDQFTARLLKARAYATEHPQDRWQELVSHFEGVATMLDTIAEAFA